MSISSGSSNSKKQKQKQDSRGKPQGWAAFDSKQRQKQFDFGNADPFPSLGPCVDAPSTSTSSSAAKSFSSVLLPSTAPPNPDFAVSHLKHLHSWADSALIRDVLYSVNNDADKASALLKQMNYVSSDSLPTPSHKPPENNPTSMLDDPSDLAAHIADLSSTLKDALYHTHPHLDNHFLPVEQEAAAAATTNMNLILGHLKSIPVEPEWEDDDVYSIRRRNAFKMIRLASRHSRAATNAFMRGDHFSAKQESVKARREWLDAERLNVEAAKEILNLRNSENNLWTLDLHGLHAAEAIQALQEHLNKIESHFPMKRQVSPGRVNMKAGIVSSLAGPASSLDVEKLDVQSMGLRQRSPSLEVITGVGNHSRGQAALPTAVKSFLGENRYHFDEARPGVIRVFPKFLRR